MIKASAPGLARSQPKSLGVLEYANSWAGAYLLRRGLHLPHELALMMEPDFAREGLRRLKPLRRLEATLTPDPGSDVARVCALESAHYMRNQLLRDADWAGMAHSLEIRVPLVDVNLLSELAPGNACAHAWRRQGSAGAGAPVAVGRRSRTAREDGLRGTDGELDRQGPTRQLSGKGDGQKGLTSRRWSRTVLAALTSPREVVAL